MKKTLLTYAFIFVLGHLSYSQTSSFIVHDDPLISTGANPWFIDSGHLNSGNYPDIVVGTYTGGTVEIYINNEDGTFATPIIKSLLNVYGVHIADINEDNENDIIASSAGANKLVWYENNGDGTFADEQIISSGVDVPGNIVTGKIDSGDTIDIALVVYGFNGDTDRVIWFANDGLPWTEQNVIPATAGLGPGDLDIADVDGDTDLDIVVANLDAKTVELYYNNWNPLTDNNPVSFTESAGGDISTGNNYLFDISFVDINDDTYIDILKVDLLSSEIAYYQNNGSGIFTYQLVNNTHPNLSQAFGVDFNNDSYVDIVAVDGLNQNDDVFWFQSDDSGNLGTKTPITDNQLHNQIYGFTINDFDFDGDLDLATVGYQDGTLKWIENQLDLLGIEDNSLNNIRIYPNPTKNKLYFKSSIAEDFNISVYDILGKKVLENTVNINKSLDVSQLNNGIYIIRFDDYYNTYKFVKE